MVRVAGGGMRRFVVVLGLAACGGAPTPAARPQPEGPAPSPRVTAPTDVLNPPTDPGGVAQPTNEVPEELIPPQGQTIIPATGAAPPEDWQCGKKPFVLGVVNESCFLRIEGATFKMGAQAADKDAPNFDPVARPEEGPVHDVTLSTFWIQKYEASVGIYDVCVRAGWCSLDDILTEGQYISWSRPDRTPYAMNGITWKGAQRLCAFLGGRLPTEAEWELAARGTTSQRFPWGDFLECDTEPSMPLTPQQMTGTELACPLMEPQRTMVGRLTSPYGLYRMAGHMWEWVGDWYAPDAYAHATGQDPTGPTSGERRVQRGGGWLDTQALDLRSAARGALPPDERLPDVGFRCVWKGG